jgi:ribosomal subunit interface protein
MNINIKATHIDLTFEIKDYVNEKIGSLSRFLDQEQDINIFVEIGKESNHHQNGPDVYMAELRFSFEGKEFYIKDHAAELFAAIDLIRDEAQRQIKDRKGKSQTLFVRGARKIKKRIKGIKPWWPFGEKTEQK